MMAFYVGRKSPKKGNKYEKLLVPDYIIIRLSHSRGKTRLLLNAGRLQLTHSL